MGKGMQLKLLLWKNFRIKRRQHLRLLVEIVLPQCLFLILLLVRKLNPELLKKNHECHFDGKAMPSAGPLPFLQSMICTANNTCHRDQRPGEFMGRIDEYNASLISQLFSDTEKFLSSRMEVDTVIQVMGDLATIAELRDLGLQGKLNCSVSIGSFLVDSTEVQQTIQDQNISLNPEIVAMLFNASVNLTELSTFFAWNSSGLPPMTDEDQTDIMGAVRGELCESDNHTEYLLLFTDPEAQVRVVGALCNLTQEQFQTLYKDVSESFSGEKFIREANHCSEKHLGKKFNYDPESVAELVDVIQGFQSLDSYQSSMSVFQEVLTDFQAQSYDNMMGNASMLWSELFCGKNNSIQDGELNKPKPGMGDEDEDDVPEYEYDKTATPFCNDVFRALHNTTGSRIMWAQLKPMIRGKILYTPDTPATRRIVKEANSSFEALAEYKQLAMDWITAYPNITEQFEDSQTLDQLRKTVTDLLDANYVHRLCSDQWVACRGCEVRASPYIHHTCPLSSTQSMHVVGSQKGKEGLLTIKSYEGRGLDTISEYLNMDLPESTIDQLSGYETREILDTYIRWLSKDPEKEGVYTWRTSLNYTTQVLTYMKNYLDCFEFNKFEGVEDETALEKKSLEYIEKGLFWSGLVFDIENNNSSNLPSHVSYKIRMDAARVDTTFGHKVLDQYWTPGNRASPLPDMKYIVYGFIYIQDMVEHGIIRLQTNITPEEEVGIYLQQFPYPCYVIDKLIKATSRGLPLFMVLAWIFTVAMNVMSIVYEKEQRLKEVMKIMGLSDGTHWMAWFITSFAVMFLSVLPMLPILIAGGTIPNADASVLFVLLLTYTVSVITFCFAISVFFTKAKLAAAAAGLIYFAFYLPYPMCYSFEETMTTWQKGIASLSPPVAFSYACSYMARYEEQQIGLQWNNVATSPIPDDGYSVLLCMVMLLLDGMIYMFIAWYVEAVFPGEFGVPRKWYFFLTKSYWCGVQYNMDDVPVNPSVELTQQAGDEFEQEPHGVTVGVSVRGLKKQYKKKAKLAVDGLNLNFFEGQITSFLGHNGAGKTTTMSILCGLFPPTEGTAYVYNQDIRKDMDNIRKSMGLCPQHNVLFEGLTVAEHMWFYARLKGMKEADTGPEIDKMISDIGLQLKRHTMAKDLSGGMQRKLSVAIAFVSGSKVVILDEPTAGVDPCARRAIWELLLKYRKDRTIILSTHFMDEADVLGDRIAIISQGRLITCGSSLFLKSRYGSGYYLTCVKSDDDGAGAASGATVEEIKAEIANEKVTPSSGESDKDEGVEDIDSGSDHSDESKLSKAPSSGIDVAAESASDLTAFLRLYVPEAKLIEDLGMETTYQLPNGPQHTASFEKLFKALDENMNKLGVTTYGISDTTLEEVFLKVADATGQDELSDENKRTQLEETTDGGMFARPVTRLSFRSRLGFLGVRKSPKKQDTRELVNAEGDADSILVDLEETDAATSSAGLPGNVTSEEIATCNGAGSYKVSGLALKWRQFMALIIKRFCFFIRSRKSFLVQIVWPAAFICLAQFTMNIRPDTPHEPPMEVTPWLLLPPNMQDPYLYTFYSNDAPDNHLTKKMEQLLTQSPYLGTRCMEKPYHNVSMYECEDDYKDSMWTEATGRIDNTIRKCTCDTGYQECPADAGDPVPPALRLPTTDYLFNMTGQDITHWLLETKTRYLRRRYGGISFGERNNLVAGNETMFAESLQRLLVAANGGQEMENVTVTLPLVLQDLEEILAQSATKKSAKIWFNNKGYVSNVAYMNQMNNLLLRANLGEGKNPALYGMSLTNHPMNRTDQQLEAFLIENGWVQVVMAICVIMALSVIPASFSQFLVQERVSGSKHLQFVSGVNPGIYWVANFIWDTLNYVVACTLCIFIFLAFQQTAFISPDNFPCLVALLMLYGWAMTPLMYVGAYFFSVPSSAIVGLSCGNIFLGFISTIATFILEQMAIEEDDEQFAFINSILTRVFLVLPQYCLGRGLIDMAANQIRSDVFALLGEKQFTSPLSFMLVGRNLLCMAVFGCLYFVIILLLEYRVAQNCVRKKGPLLQPEDVMDEDVDVKRERQRVLNGNTTDDILLLKGLSKVYDHGKSQQHIAVDNLTVGVKQGECFGLLGVNGAGKTSTFKMLTGDTAVSGGDATLAGHSILTDMVSVHQNLGYCPQFDALCPLMTGAEHLAFYARIRGVPEKDVKVVTAWGIKTLGLLRHCNKLSQEYSGGNKRKLSTAIALVGNPPVIFLDEPTTGMDPKARRFLWTCIMDIVRSGRSVVLTSHSMEECEALCGRIAIMVNGRLQCLGSIQHIKGRFGDGYTLLIRTQSASDLDAVLTFVSSAFPEAQLKERQNTMVQYQLPSAGLPLAEVFGLMERERERLLIEDYSVSQTTLDQVFIYFAKHQKDSVEDVSTTGRSIALDVYVDAGAEGGGATPYTESALKANQTKNYDGAAVEGRMTSPDADLLNLEQALRDSTLNLVAAEIPSPVSEIPDEPLVSFC